MTTQLALDLGDQDLGARRGGPSAARVTGAPTPLERAARRSRSSRTKPTAKFGPISRSAAVTAPFPVVDEAWRLDEHTREVGLRGVAEVRRVLAAIGDAA